MICELCESKTRTIDTRTYKDPQGYYFVQRILVCRGCGYRWTTIEVSQEVYNKTVSETR